MNEIWWDHHHKAIYLPSCQQINGTKSEVHVNLKRTTHHNFIRIQPIHSQSNRRQMTKIQSISMTRKKQKKTHLPIISISTYRKITHLTNLVTEQAMRADNIMQDIIFWQWTQSTFLQPRKRQTKRKIDNHEKHSIYTPEQLETTVRTYILLTICVIYLQEIHVHGICILSKHWTDRRFYIKS